MNMLGEVFMSETFFCFNLYNQYTFNKDKKKKIFLYAFKKKRN